MLLKKDRKEVQNWYSYIAFWKTQCWVSGFLKGTNLQDLFAETHLFSKHGVQLLSGIKFAVKVFRTPTIADNQKLQFINICAESQKYYKTFADKHFQNTMPKTGYLENNAFCSWCIAKGEYHKVPNEILPEGRQRSIVRSLLQSLYLLLLDRPFAWSSKKQVRNFIQTLPICDWLIHALKVFNNLTRKY